jgi:hypothetical protein
MGARTGGRRPVDAGRLTASIGGLEQLDRVARGIVEHDLGAARSSHHVAPEPGPGSTQALDLGGDVVDDELDPVPPGWRPSGIGRPAELFGPLRRSRRSSRATSAKAGDAFESNEKPRRSV